MSMSDLLSHPPIEQIYRTVQPNSTIDFGSVDIILLETANSKSRQATARAELRLFPKASL